MTMDPGRWGVVGGDVEPPRLLDTLARRHPEDEFYLLGRTAAEDPESFGLPGNVINPWVDLDVERKALMSNPDRNGSQLSMDMRRRFVAWNDQRILPLWADLDAVVVWLGQHGSVHAPDIPKVHGTWHEKDLVTPQDWAVLYGAPVIRGINMFRKKNPLEYEEVWLVSDARNYLKAHDLKWPLRHPILAQYEFERDFWVQRYGDARTPEETGFGGHVTGTDKGQGTHWRTRAEYVPSTLEICGILPEHTGVKFDDNFGRKYHFGLFINEARAVSGIQRADVVREWVRYASPDWIHGQWTPKGIERAGVADIQPLAADLYFPQIQNTRCTFTTPSSGSGWATTKPWEAFGAGTVCFKHPGYDTQNHVYGRFSEDVRTWLCPKTPRELLARIDALENDEATWRYLVTAQREVFDAAVTNLQHVRMIEERIWT
jgi:hypothetical protein